VKPLPKLLRDALRTSSSNLKRSTVSQARDMPQESTNSKAKRTSPELDELIAEAQKRLQTTLGAEVLARTGKDTIVRQKRAMHIPVEAIARKLNRRFWYRLIKRTPAAGSGPSSSRESR
jgi:hypothetical protein